jgi:hypothetical protein
MRTKYDVGEGMQTTKPNVERTKHANRKRPFGPGPKSVIGRTVAHALRIRPDGDYETLSITRRASEDDTSRMRQISADSELSNSASHLKRLIPSTQHKAAFVRSVGSLR